jgi:predicted acetyltransferase
MTVTAVDLEPCGPERRETIVNLFQFYVHDFAEFWTERRAELQEDGRFGRYPPLDDYWDRPGGEAFLIRADGRIAGFALVNREAHSGLPVDFNMGEFFVARHYRREAVGRRAALAVIAPRRGLWEIAVARRNIGAQAFWRRVSNEAAAGPVQALDRNDGQWDGLVLRFSVA